MCNNIGGTAWLPARLSALIEGNPLWLRTTPALLLLRTVIKTSATVACSQLLLLYKVCCWGKTSARSRCWKPPSAAAPYNSLPLPACPHLITSCFQHFTSILLSIIPSFACNLTESISTSTDRIWGLLCFGQNRMVEDRICWKRSLNPCLLCTVTLELLAQSASSVHHPDRLPNVQDRKRRLLAWYWDHSPTAPTPTILEYLSKGF